MLKGKILALALTMALLAIAAAAAGCGAQASGEDSSRLTKDEYSRITVGMSSSQLKEMAGEPSRTETRNMGGGHSMGDGSTMGSAMTAEYWYYQGEKGWVRVEVADSKVTSKSGY